MESRINKIKEEESLKSSKRPCFLTKKEGKVGTCPYPLKACFRRFGLKQGF